MRPLLAALAVSLALTLVAPATIPSASAQERVEVRGEPGDGRARLVFDWTEPVSFAAEISDGVLTVRFARPFDAALDAATSALAPYIAAGAIRPDRRTAVFSLKRAMTFRSSPAGKRAVIELIELGANKKPAATAEAPPKSATPKSATPKSATPKSAAPKSATSKPAAQSAAPIKSAQNANARVQLGQSSDGTRLEIDFGRPVAARARENGRNVVISFDVPGALDLGDLRDRSLNLVEGIDAASGGAGPQLSLTLADRAQLKQSRSGNRVILDIVPGAARPAVAAAAPSMPAAKPAPAKSATAKSEPAAKPEPLKAAKPGAKSPAAPPPAATQPAATQPAATQPADPPGPAPAQAQASPQGDASGGPVLPVGVKLGDGKVALRFGWSEPVAAAAFRRGLQVWIVFDRPAQLDLAAIKKVPSNLISGAYQTPQADATALRLFLPATINPTLARDGNAWTIDLHVQPMRPESSIAIAPRRPESGLAELALSVEQPGRTVSLRDPDVGDRLIVVPVAKAGLGVAGTREFAEFRLLDSAQGIAVEPVADRVSVDTAADHVRVAAPGGLNLSVRDSQRQAAEGERVPAGERVLNFAKWSSGGIAELNANRRRLNLALSNAPTEGRNAVRLEMAHLYLANLMGNDALGMIERIEADEPGVATEPRFRALKGAAQFLSRRYADSARTLADPRLDGNNEIRIWRAMIAQQMGEKSAANSLFRAAGYSIADDYPPTLRVDMALRAADAALDDAGPGVAGSLIDQVSHLVAETSHQGDVDYLRGRIAAVAGNKDDASVLWKQVVERREPPSWVRAELALVNSGLADNTLTRVAAIDRLERLRYGWRGGELERSILALLAKLQIDGSHDAAGLAVYRDLVTLFPESGEAREAADEMGKAFGRLFVDGGADALAPLKALGLYDTFRELTPAGPRGDELIRKLADRVAGIDLLGRSAELLDDLVRRRLSGEAKAETGTRLALVRLQNGEPAQALEALEISRVEPMPDALKQERGQLRARALFAQAKPAEALAVLAQDQSEAAERLRQDIHWRQGDWTQAAKVAMRRAERLTGTTGAGTAGAGAGKPEAKPTDDAAAAIMSATVASALANDKATLATLRQRYAQAMDQTPFKSPFRLIANGSGSLADLAQMARTLEAAQGFQKYLADVKPATGGAATGGAKDAPQPPAPAGKLN